MIWLLAVAAVFCNVAAQVSIKLANQSPHTEGSWVAPWLTPWIISALVLYALSFVLTVRIFAALPLSIAAPAMAGATFFLVAVSSNLLLGEILSYEQLLGMTLIVIGIYFLISG
jgi:multidrug transporter EmrE-like cation transporter